MAGEKIMIARQDTLEDVQRDTQSILADTTAIGRDVPQIKQIAEENEAAVADIQGKGERILKSPKGLQVFIPRSGTTPCAVYSLPISVDSCAFAEAGGKVHIFGNSKSTAREHYIFDPETGTSEQQENLPYDFYGYGMALGTEDGRVHLFGGSGGERKHWIWDNGSWTEGANLSNDFAFGCAVANGADIFFIPGNTKGLYEWKAATNTNTYRQSLSAMTYNFYDGFLLIANKRLYFGGGYNPENGQNMTTVWQTASLTSFTITAASGMPSSFRRRYGSSSGYGYIYKNFLCLTTGSVYTINSSGAWNSVKVAPYDYSSAKPTSQAWRYVKDERSFVFKYRSVYVMNAEWSLFLPKGTAILCGGYYYCPLLRKKGDAFIVEETGIVKICTGDVDFLTDNGMADDSKSITFYIDGEETT